MENVAGYERESLLAEGKYTKVYRGRRVSDNQPVILKMLKEAYPSPERVAWFKQEYELTHGLKIEGVTQTLDIQNQERNWILVVEDFGGTSLNRLGLIGAISIDEFLRIARELARILGEIHHHNIIHKDINPANIVLNQDTGEIKIIDFGISTRLSREQPEFMSFDVLEGTLAYISPEQTGRMNRAIDYRTDFYSLGVTFYELLTGQLPFVTSDPLALIHGHIAHEPTAPDVVDPAIPSMISAIVLKLMAKNSEDRYLSASGLLADLDFCADALLENGEIATFTLGENEVLGRFRLPQTLYGRDTERTALLDGFDRVKRGSKELMMVAGYSGIGKSSLVQELYRPLTQERGYFVSGKFDQFQRAVPYAAFLAAFEALIQQLLTEEDGRIQQLKSELLEALGPSGQVLVDVIPDVELIIGSQPAVPTLGIVETQNRFNFVIQQFLQVIVRADSPLVLFLDDMQWVDPASLHLLTQLATNPRLHYFYFIGAYRNNEVSESHSLMFTLAEIERANTAVQTITLEALSFADCQSFIRDTLGENDLHSVEILTSLAMQKTAGNPFFLTKFLQYLYTAELLNFDPQGEKWIWDIEQIGEQTISDNVVDLLLNEIAQLPAESQHILALAAGIHNRFDLALLAGVVDEPPAAVSAHLWPALDSGFLIPLSNAYQLASQSDGAAYESMTYKFAHDRIQQAAYELVPEADRAQQHLKVGRLLLDRASYGTLSDQIFDVVNHLNQAIELISDDGERLALAQYNFLAGVKANGATAYKAASGYLETGWSLLPENNWETSYQLSYDLYLELATSKDLLNQRDEAAEMFAVLHKYSADRYDRLQVYTREMMLLNNLRMFSRAVDTGLEALRLFDYDLPVEPTADVIGAEIGLELKSRGTTPILELVNRPEVSDPAVRAVIKLLEAILPCAFLAQKMSLWSLVILKTINLAHKHGVTLDSVTAFCSYGIIVTTQLGNAQGGYEFGRASELLANRFGGLGSMPQVKFVLGAFLGHRGTHIDQVINDLFEGYKLGVASGSLQYAGYSAAIIPIMRLHHGATPLDEALSETGRIRQFGMENRLDDVLRYTEVLSFINRQFANAESTSAWDDQPLIESIVEHKQFNVIVWCYNFRAQAQYMLNDYEQAFSSTTQALEYLPYNVGTLAEPLTLTYRVLSLIKLYPTMAEESLEEARANLDSIFEQITLFADDSPGNYAHVRDLVGAELAQLNGETARALKLYESAISLASASGFYAFAAVANEHSGRFYLSMGIDRIAKDFLRHAYLGYENWGASSKTASLKREFEWMTTEVEKATEQNRFTTGSGGLSMQKHTTSGNAFASATVLDSASAVKASHAISGEIELDQLLHKLLAVVTENAGAQHGYLLLPTKNEWFVEGETHVGQELLPVLQSVPLTADLLPLSIINYVTRAKMAVVIANAAEDADAYAHDPYIIQKQPQSVFCMPLLTQGRLIGLLYLENNLVHDAFTAERIEILHLLSTQAAISLENARLYAQQVTLTQSYSRFVLPEYLEFLQKDSITDVGLGDHVSKEMAIIFSDIRGFTSISEKLDSQANFDFVNGYWQAISPHVREHRGIIVKYLGDGMMAMFENGVDDALRASIAKMREVYCFSQTLVAQGLPEINIGVGVNFGRLMFGIIGEENRMQGDVFSDDVNTAARVEGLTKFYGVSIILTELAYQALDTADDYRLRYLDQIVVKGRAEPIAIYEVLDGLPDEILEQKWGSIDEFMVARDDYAHGRLAAAQEKFVALNKLYPRDRVFELYLERVQLLQERGLPENWTGVWQMTQK